MTGPQYINDLSSLYTRMYNHPGRERPLEENFEPSNKPNVEVVEDEEPNWKKLIRGMPKKQKRHMSPTIADVPRDNIPDAHEEEENQDVGVGSDIMGTYLDALEKKKILDGQPGGGETQDPEFQAHEYLKTVIDKIPTAVGGVNIHTEIKKAFIAGINAT
tara:strand:+ start:1722 stop:2201 length:480 start_codon:yes stop_codon:yes gene_type:complete